MFIGKNKEGIECRYTLLERMMCEGYCVFPKLLNSESVEIIRDVAISGFHSNRPPTPVFFGPNPLIERPDILVPMIASRNIINIIEEIIGPFVQLDSISLVGIPPNSNAGISWHRDVYGSMPRAVEYNPPRAFNLLVYLQEINELTGKFRLIPGSHREPTFISGDALHLPHKNEALLALSSGDAVLIDTNLVHSRSINLSSLDRLHLSVIYNHSCMRTMIDYTDSMLKKLQADIIDTGNRRLMRLFGSDISAINRYNSGFMEPDEVLWKRWKIEDGYIKP